MHDQLLKSIKYLSEKVQHLKDREQELSTEELKQFSVDYDYLQAIRKTYEYYFGEK